MTRIIPLGAAAALLLIAAPAAAFNIDENYCDPATFPSARLGNFVGLELGVPFDRTSSGLPGATLAGVSGQFLMSGASSFKLTLGREFADFVMPTWHDSLRVDAQFMFGGTTEGGSWSATFLDFDLANFSLGFSSATAFAFSVTSVRGFSLQNVPLTFEFHYGVAYRAIPIDEGPGWLDNGQFFFPLAARASYRVIEGGHADLELRLPVYFPPLRIFFRSGPDFLIPVDVYAGWRQILIGKLVVGGGVFFGLTDRSDLPGRELFGVNASAKYAFY